jgi:hypothetical protein
LTDFVWSGVLCLCELVFEDADDNWEKRSDYTGGSDIANLAERLQPSERSEQLAATNTADQAENRIHNGTEALVLDQSASDISANGARNQTQEPSDYWACHGKTSVNDLKLCGRPSSLLKENDG